MSTDAPALLLIAHGTRRTDIHAEMADLVDLVGDRLGVPVAAGYLEDDLSEPGPAAAAGQLVAAGVSAVVTLPLLLLGAGHAKTDVVGAIADIQISHPGLVQAHGAVLGLHPALFALAHRQVAAARPAAWGEDPGDDEALLVTGSGSSDPDANGDLAKAVRFLAELTGHRWVDSAYAGVTWPTADVALRRMAEAGAGRVVRFSWSLLAGTLERRVDDMVAGVAAETRLAVADAGRFGPSAAVADAVVDRYRQALAGDAAMNCDLCQFRLPLPGREARAGMPSAGGTGEHLHPEAAAIQASRATES